MMSHTAWDLFSASGHFINIGVFINSIVGLDWTEKKCLKLIGCAIIIVGHHILTGEGRRYLRS